MVEVDSKFKLLIKVTSRPRAGFAPQKQCQITNYNSYSNSMLLIPEIRLPDSTDLAFMSHFEEVCFLRISREMETQAGSNCAYNTPRHISFP